MKRLVWSLLAALLLFACAKSCQVDPITPPPDGGTGGQVSTGGSSATTGGATIEGGSKATGGMIATGGSSLAAFKRPPCSKILAAMARPVVKHTLGHRTVAFQLRRAVRFPNLGLPVRSAIWPRNIKWLDQDGVGACTFFAVANELSTQPFKWAFTNTMAFAGYKLTTEIDGFAGSWPKVDTGSDGESALMAAVQLGYIKTWVAANTLSDMHQGIQVRPGIFWSTWTTDMYSPDTADASCGQVHPTGQTEGQHQYEYIGFEIIGAQPNPEIDREWYFNSWDDWGPAHGYFWMTSKDTDAFIQQGSNADFADLPNVQGDLQ